MCCSGWEAFPPWFGGTLLRVVLHVYLGLTPSRVVCVCAFSSVSIYLVLLVFVLVLVSMMVLVFVIVFRSFCSCSSGVRGVLFLVSLVLWCVYGEFLASPQACSSLDSAEHS